MMYISPPGWDSLDSVRRIHAIFEAMGLVFFAALVVFDALAHLVEKRKPQLEKFGIVFFALAVVSEILAYPYSRRNDALSSREIAATYKLAGDANERASNANERAAQANQRAEELAHENAKLRGVLDRSSEEAKVNEERLRQQNLATETRLAEANTKLEQERFKRIELEKSLAPRVLGFQIGPGNKTSFDELRPFAGTQVIFDVLADAEAQRAAQEIGSVLQAAGWKIVAENVHTDLYIGYFDGIMIEPIRPNVTPPM